MQASLQMTVFFDLCIGRSPFSEMEPQRGGIELKARQIVTIHTHASYKILYSIC